MYLNARESVSQEDLLFASSVDSGFLMSVCITEMLSFSSLGAGLVSDAFILLSDEVQ